MSVIHLYGKMSVIVDYKHQPLSHLNMKRIDVSQDIFFGGKEWVKHNFIIDHRINIKKKVRYIVKIYTNSVNASNSILLIYTKIPCKHQDRPNLDNRSISDPTSGLRSPTTMLLLIIKQIWTEY